MKRVDKDFMEHLPEAFQLVTLTQLVQKKAGHQLVLNQVEAINQIKEINTNLRILWMKKYLIN